MMTKPNLLNANGTPNPGYDTHEFLHYNKENIKALPWRVKEWDFYQVLGRFSCKVELDDGSEVNLSDLPAFAEHAINNW